MLYICNPLRSAIVAVLIVAVQLSQCKSKNSEEWVADKIAVCKVQLTMYRLKLALYCLNRVRQDSADYSVVQCPMCSVDTVDQTRRDCRLLLQPEEFRLQTSDCTSHVQSPRSNFPSTSFTSSPMLQYNQYSSLPPILDSRIKSGRG